MILYNNEYYITFKNVQIVSLNSTTNQIFGQRTSITVIRTVINIKNFYIIYIHIFRNRTTLGSYLRHTHTHHAISPLPLAISPVLTKLQRGHPNQTVKTSPTKDSFPLHTLKHTHIDTPTLPQAHHHTHSISNEHTHTDKYNYQSWAFGACGCSVKSKDYFQAKINAGHLGFCCSLIWFRKLLHSQPHYKKPYFLARNIKFIYLLSNSPNKKCKK